LHAADFHAEILQYATSIAVGHVYARGRWQIWSRSDRRYASLTRYPPRMPSSLAWASVLSSERIDLYESGLSLGVLLSQKTTPELDRSACLSNGNL
jgi:hypothetical protein